MHCDTVRERLDALADGELSAWAAWNVQRHLAHCPACAAELDSIRRLTARARAWQDEAAPAGLAARLATAPVLAPPPVAFRPRHSPGRRLAASAAAALLGVCLVLGLHSHVDALQEMEQAVSGARNVHMTLWWRSGPDDNGPMQKTEEVWYQDGCWRRTDASGNGGDRIFRRTALGTEFYRYEPARRQVAQYRELAPQAGAGAFTLQGLATSQFPVGNASRTEVVGMETVDGRRLEEVVVSLADDSERMLFWLDPVTHLPAYAEKQDRAQGRWVVQGRMQMVFNQDIPASVFDPDSLKPQ